MGGIDVHLPLPQETTSVFASLPEWIVDDIADFLLFALQYFPLGTHVIHYSEMLRSQIGLFEYESAVNIH